MPHSLVGSVAKKYNIGDPDEDDPLKAMIWQYLGLTRIYTKRKGQHPDLAEPVVLSKIRKGTTVKALCQNVSTQMLRDFNFAMVWGKSAKHSPQRCGINHPLEDEDVVQVVTKTNAQQRQSKNYQAIVQGVNDKVRYIPIVKLCIPVFLLKPKLFLLLWSSVSQKEVGGKEEEAGTSSGISTGGSNEEQKNSRHVIEVELLVVNSLHT